MPTHPIIVEDISGVVNRTKALWPSLQDASVLITGATGFFGTWLLETLLTANCKFSLGCRVIAVSRDPRRFAMQAPHLAEDPAITWICGDVRDFPSPAGPVTHIIHAAAEVGAKPAPKDPQTTFDVCVEGTRRVLALAREKRATRMLFTSSGAVYGRQPPDLPRIPEDFPGGPDPFDPGNAYAEGKRAAEQLCAIACLPAPTGAGLHVSIARCFAFVGPRLPLDAHFAIGNFIRDALAGGPICGTGDGTPIRSYLYTADLVERLFAILLRGASGQAYNVGSEEAVSIRDLAGRVADVAWRLEPAKGRPAVSFASHPTSTELPHRYVPSCAAVDSEQRWQPAVSLDEAIARTMAFARVAGTAF